jgi:hypothetical protein
MCHKQNPATLALMQSDAFAATEAAQVTTCQQVHMAGFAIERFWSGEVSRHAASGEPAATVADSAARPTGSVRKHRRSGTSGSRCLTGMSTIAYQKGGE